MDPSCPFLALLSLEVKLRLLHDNLNLVNPAAQGGHVQVLSRAVEIAASRFGVDINLAELGILADVRTLMAPDAYDIRAELHKLTM